MPENALTFVTFAARMFLKDYLAFAARMFLKDCHCVCCMHVLKRLSLFVARTFLKDCHCLLHACC